MASPLKNGSRIMLVFGDTSATAANSTKGPTGPFGSSSVVESAAPFDCSAFVWDITGGKYYQPLASSRKTGVDESTVPAGAIEINNTEYLYSMRVNLWGDVTHAHGVLFKRDGGGPFVEAAEWPVDGLFVNAAPVQGRLPDGTDAIFVAVTALYRKSPVYMAYALPGDIGNASDYHYLTGYGPDGSPIWTSDIALAKPLPGFEGVDAGELSLAYDAPLKEYLLMFNDYGKPYTGFQLASSATPYGPFSAPAHFFPCGPEGAAVDVPRPAWMQPGWAACYGGYILPDDFGPDGHDVYFTFSLWDPYATMLMKIRLGSS